MSSKFNPKTSEKYHKRSKPLPVTLLSGFLGSGKTTLVEHILASSQHSLRVAVIVNDMSTINIDASLISQHIVSGTKEKLIQLSNGCICCTLRGDLLEELVCLTKLGSVDYVIIESTGIGEPMQVAETFTQEFSQAMVEQSMDTDVESVESAAILKEIASLGGLHTIARLDCTVTVIDTFNLFTNFSTAEFLSDRWGKDNISPEDERTITDLMVDQIEFADVIVMNKIDRVNITTRDRVLGLVKKLNPTAKILEATYSNIDVSEIVDTGLFDFEKAATGAGWLQSLHEMEMYELNEGKKRRAPKPETVEYGITSFVYRARRPFHPKRLYGLLRDIFILMQDVEEIEDESEESSNDVDTEDGESGMDEDVDLYKEIDPEVVVENKRKHPVFAGLLRSKGFFWLATRPAQHGEWSQAGAILTLKGGAPWFCMLENEDWPEDPDFVAAIKKDFEGRWGDRRQEIVFIGEKLDHKAITDEIDKALLTKKEMKEWESVMGNRRLNTKKVQDKLCDLFDDGFEDWPDFDMHARHAH